MASRVKRATLAVFFVIAALFCASSVHAVTESPFIVAHKKVTLERLDHGTERVSVSVDIYNRGSVSAYDVSLTDDSWNQEVFHSVQGNTSMSWERLDADAVVSHSFELGSKVKGMYYGAPALVTYRIPSNTAVQVAYSTPILPLDILSEKVTYGKFKWAKRLLANYGSQISVISVVVLFGFIVATPSKSSAAQGNKKRR